MEAKELICATWVLAAFTGILACATIAYAITTYKLYKGSQDQIKLLGELIQTIIRLKTPYG